MSCAGRMCRSGCLIRPRPDGSSAASPTPVTSGSDAGHSTVRVLLARAARKLRAKNRAELVALVAAHLRAAAREVDEGS